MNTSRKLVAAAIVVGSVFGAPAAAFAHDGGGRGGRGGRTPLTAEQQAAREAEHKAAADKRATELAGRLGVTKDKLIQAAKDQAKAEIDAALAAGRITADQATAARARVDAGTGLGRGFGHRGGRGPKGAITTTTVKA